MCYLWALLSDVSKSHIFESIDQFVNQQNRTQHLYTPPPHTTQIYRAHNIFYKYIDFQHSDFKNHLYILPFGRNNVFWLNDGPTHRFHNGQTTNNRDTHTHTPHTFTHIYTYTHLDIYVCNCTAQHSTAYNAWWNISFTCTAIFLSKWLTHPQMTFSNLCYLLSDYERANERVCVCVIFHVRNIRLFGRQFPSGMHCGVCMRCSYRRQTQSAHWKYILLQWFFLFFLLSRMEKGWTNVKSGKA